MLMEMIVVVFSRCISRESFVIFDQKETVAIHTGTVPLIAQSVRNCLDLLALLLYNAIRFNDSCAVATRLKSDPKPNHHNEQRIQHFQLFSSPF
jgi:hypothetical protein